MKAYKKEVRSTIGFGIGYVLLGHTGLWVVMLGSDNSVRLFGLPAHYLVAILLGSFGVLVWSVIWCIFANRLEDEIEAENAAATGGPRTDANVTASTSAASPAAPGQLAGAAK
ncbi:hypothetical protein PMES_00421 [Profundibacterium mesophilum KAUST100406-0324]|uniref:Uncharacterized protein n=1 Tax=Profundibacterium mesophilum KAUST100406-0324 TaxID=1037889 RepID=A0A921NR93_9RHOB|nr:hypothetical protein PMES_00421 [Profundibacterium mesophilum KAUST100406-0324]